VAGSALPHDIQRQAVPDQIVSPDSEKLIVNPELNKYHGKVYGFKNITRRK